MIDFDLSFQSGADLWMAPSPKQSSWTQKIDWLINFQILKAKHLTARNLSQELEQICRWCQIKQPDHGPTPERFLLPVAPHLPAQWLAVLSPTEDGQAFLTECLTVLKNFQAKKARVFLPPKMDLELAKKFFNKQNISTEIQFIPESSHDRQ